jgi:hypothetical protein
MRVRVLELSVIRIRVKVLELGLENTREYVLFCRTGMNYILFLEFIIF